MQKILKVIPMKPWNLTIHLEDGEALILNMEPRLGTIRFGALTDPVLFSQVTTDGYCIRWGRKAELSLEEIFETVRFSGRTL